MKIAQAAVIAGLLLVTPALAQGVIYRVGDRVEALNKTTGNWETATILRIDGGRYLLHSESRVTPDWDVDIGSIRGPGSANSSAAQPDPGSASGPARTISDGSVTPAATRNGNAP